MDVKIKLPALQFVELEDKTEEGLLKYMAQNSYASGFLVHLRMKYEHENRWEYLVEFCRTYYDGIEWEMDWHEGQQDVEYIGVCPIFCGMYRD